MSTSEAHERKLKEVIENLRNEGYKVFDLERKCPDAIAMKDGNIYAVEILKRIHTLGKGNKSKGWTAKSKKEIYHMFDDVLLFSYIIESKK